MRSRFLLVLAALAALATSAPEDTQPPVAPEPSPASLPLEVRVAQVAVAIERAPADADAILAGAGMTEAELRDHLFAIARDPGRTRAYLDARDAVR